MTLDEILRSVQERRREIAEEDAKLAAIEQALTGGADDAPFGLLPNGKPRKRPFKPRRRRGNHNPSEAPKAPQKGARRPQEARINVLSSTAPTPAELEDREVAFTTQEPA